MKKDTEGVVPLATVNCMISRCNVCSTDTVYVYKLTYRPYSLKKLHSVDFVTAEILITR